MNYIVYIVAQNIDKKYLLLLLGYSKIPVPSKKLRFFLLKVRTGRTKLASHLSLTCVPYPRDRPVTQDIPSPVGRRRCDNGATHA